ncbi:MFS transporter [Cellulosimicrobium cellulans]|uniref:MFS transporter n=1 Tax=Cellulosimicrobium cellulans TaxID=1710 RepID=UPI001962E825|nr:MFS transporter [Cellulosimicrobium cellulans]MBN0038806.1 MFS transporter [Cellulosimicrobium cellulans]
MSTTSTPTTATVPDPGTSSAGALPTASGARSPGTLPVGALVALAASGFLTLLTEILPAGVLPAMAADLGVGAGAAGQTVTAFAVGAIVAAIPLTRVTARWDRRTLLLVTVTGFVVANTVTAVSSSFTLTLVARFAAGLVAGLTWALLPGYVRRIAPADRLGRAMTIAMAGGPLALTLGVPAGAVLGAAVGWRWTFGVLSLVGLGLLAGVRFGAPAAAGTPRGAQLAITAVLPRPGLRPVLLVTGLNVLANTSLYTYVAVHLAHLGQGSRTSALLLVLGAASAGALVLLGSLIDRRLRALTLGSVVVFALAMLVLGLAPTSTVVVVVAVAAWGAAFGGAGTLYTTAAARAAGDGADVAQSALVTVWNTSVALGGAVGGAVLAVAGPGGLPWVSLALMVPVLATVALGRRHSFR